MYPWTIDRVPMGWVVKYMGVVQGEPCLTLDDAVDFMHALDALNG